MEGNVLCNPLPRQLCSLPSLACNLKNLLRKPGQEEPIFLMSPCMFSHLLSGSLSCDMQHLPISQLIASRWTPAHPLSKATTESQRCPPPGLASTHQQMNSHPPPCAKQVIIFDPVTEDPIKTILVKKYYKVTADGPSLK